MYAFLKFRAAKASNLWNRIAEPFQTKAVCSRTLYTGKVSALGRTGLASATKPQAHREWSSFRQNGRLIPSGNVTDNRYRYDVATLTKLPNSYTDDINNVGVSKAFGSAPLLTHYVEPFSVMQFATKYVLSYRFFFIYMARTTFQVFHS
ncbi:hypothetical protein, conserved [Babesia ovata]|uniref:Uncharacterized protein n=1 Tax=Babesia ovata TaxID=189622 RepID=A0A2H6KC74_9APIC|nr:uncharacterized protein BOVATA_020890 [Babesia ovata]GBE60596.1 hypothetical protein, conserved [Babesia ovata]